MFLFPNNHQFSAEVDELQCDSAVSRRRGEQRPLLAEATVPILLLLNSMEAPEDKLVFYNS